NRPARRSPERSTGSEASSRLGPTAIFSPQRTQRRLRVLCALCGESQSLKGFRQSKPQTVAQNGRAAAADLVVDLVARVSAAEVRRHDEAILKTIGKLRDVIEVGVAIASGALLMPIGHERAFDQQHLRAKERVLRF